MNISITLCNENPHAIITPQYQKPNAYDDTAPIVTTSRNSSRSSKKTSNSSNSRYTRRKSSFRSIASTSTDMYLSTPASPIYQVPHTPSDSPELSPQKSSPQIDMQKITSFILSQSNPTIQGLFGDKAHIHSIRHAPSYASLKLSTNDIIPVTDSPKISHGHDDTQVDYTTISPIEVKKNQSSIIKYDIEKTTLSRSDQYSLYYTNEYTHQKTLVYRKIQPFSFYESVGMLYKTLGLHNNSGEGVKVAEVRRGLFQRDIMIETADYIGSQCNMAKHIEKKKVKPSNVHVHELLERAHNSELVKDLHRSIFEFETIFHGTLIRWKRSSILSHDFTCEIKLSKKKHIRLHKADRNGKIRADADGFIDSDSDDDGDDHDNHSHKTCRRWKLIANYKSNIAGLHMGELSIDCSVLNQMDMKQRDALESNLVITCCVLLDVIRDSLKKSR